MKTYDVHFNNAESSNNKGFKLTYEKAMNYIRIHKGTNESYFHDYRGGIVSVVCREDGETVYEEEI